MPRYVLATQPQAPLLLTEMAYPESGYLQKEIRLHHVWLVQPACAAPPTRRSKAMPMAAGIWERCPPSRAVQGAAQAPSKGQGAAAGAAAAARAARKCSRGGGSGDDDEISSKNLLLPRTAGLKLFQIKFKFSLGFVLKFAFPLPLSPLECKFQSKTGTLTNK